MKHLTSVLRSMRQYLAAINSMHNGREIQVRITAHAFSVYEIDRQARVARKIEDDEVTK